MPAAAAARDSRGASSPAPTCDPTAGRDRMLSMPCGFGAGGGASANELSAARGAPKPFSNEPLDRGGEPRRSDMTQKAHCIKRIRLSAVIEVLFRAVKFLLLPKSDCTVYAAAVYTVIATVRSCTRCSNRIRFSSRLVIEREYSLARPDTK